MPCYEIRTYTTNLQVANPDLLREALRALGINVRKTQNLWRLVRNGYEIGTWRQGALTVQDAELGAEIAQAYGDQVIMQVAQEYNLSYTVDEETPHTFLLEGNFE